MKGEKNLNFPDRLTVLIFLTSSKQAGGGEAKLKMSLFPSRLN
jgi:hypothetical protein